ncbi:aconitate hydratase AcnA [Aquabacterium sp. OR-4]|uniref:aconitate hydratase AcnA n=1 Tax=Aquabacterium sp. OR-4 TaxID=2978127 RepID=UPI0028C60067|nr:aconitate hydratase AcnA [Aquabacterium sp. OR-4]MDT7834098.1 aconitate hydratase AcnA [Aquabacterium sp. OR-4]
MALTPQDTRRPFALAGGRRGEMHALGALPALGLGDVSRLPVSLRILLESMLRHVDGQRVTEAQVRALAAWQPQAQRTEELPFVVSRILLQDFTGVPLLCDLAAMRDVALQFGREPGLIEPLVPVDLVVDHSVQVDHFREADALDLNMKLEFARNAERYRFLKWGAQAFRRLRVVPPGVGIVHQVNLEHLARGVHWQGDLCFPDTLVGTDSHTTMVNALGVLGWGVGGIEAEAGLLGMPVSILTPDVVGVHLAGRLRAGTTATDLVLTLTEQLRAANVVGQFVEFFGEGAASLSLPDRATLANMAPEYGATVGFFPPDDVAADYLAATGRSANEVDAFRCYFQAQQMFGMPRSGDIDYSRVLTLNLDQVVSCVAGPGRPQDRVALPDLKRRFLADLRRPATDGGQGLSVLAAGQRVALATGASLGHGSVLIAAITSCTNTSNPSVMLAAGLLARNALSRGLSVPAHIKTSLAPGSRVVTDYLAQAGLLAPLAQLGFRVVAYGCTTCIGNSGPLDEEVADAVAGHALVVASVLSGNRNFESRIHPQVRANYLMSPPLVVAFALAGRVDIDLDHEALGNDALGRPVLLRDVWPSAADLAEAQRSAAPPSTYQRLYAAHAQAHPSWTAIVTPQGPLAAWAGSTYIARPPFLDGFELEPPAWLPVRNARALALLGDSVTTDHISPAGAIARDSPAGVWLLAAGVAEASFNSYGSRRGQHEVMLRGTFANPRLRNLMLPAGPNGRPVEGGMTLLRPDGTRMSIYDAAMAHRARGTPTLVFAGHDYGSGSSRDWAAKGTQLLGVRAVVARSYERIHRSNLVGMGVLPLQFGEHDSIASLGLTGGETFDLLGIDDGLQPGQAVTLRIAAPDGQRRGCRLRLRIDTPMEVATFCDGGLLPHVMRSLLRVPAAPAAAGP